MAKWNIEVYFKPQHTGTMEGVINAPSEAPEVVGWVEAPDEAAARREADRLMTRTTWGIAAWAPTNAMWL